MEEKVKEIIAEQLGISIESVTHNALIQETLGADSLDHIEVIMCIEEEYSIHISDEAAEKIVTVQDLIDVVKGNSGQ